MTYFYAELIKKREQLIPIILDSGVSTEPIVLKALGN
jgi:hypothetical protein